MRDNQINLSGSREAEEILVIDLSEQQAAIGLPGFVLFEELPRLFEGERVSVDDQLVFAGVIGDGDDGVDTMAVLTESLDDEVDVYHAWKSNSSRVFSAGKRCWRIASGIVKGWKCREVSGGIGGSTEGSFHMRRGVGPLKLRAVCRVEKDNGPENDNS
jgi:hypothetical protein